MAKDRQRAKQRQAERRARRLAGEGGETPPSESGRGNLPGIGAPDVTPVGPGIDPDLAVGAPPQDEGRSDAVLDGERGLFDRDTPATEDEALQEIEDWEVSEDDHLTEEEVAAELEAERELAGTGEAGYEVRGRRGADDADKHRHRPRVIQFLIASWAELQRVQWPNRQALITLTGVVLGFVLIAGGYLGLLDAIFSELIKAIL